MEESGTAGTAGLRAQLDNPSSLISADSLLDTLTALHSDCQPEAVKRVPTVAAFCERYDATVEEVLQGRTNPNSFELLKVLGRGAFGEVQLVKHKKTSDVFALKKLSKYEMMKKKETAFFWEERNIMAFTESPWLVKLHHAFQDAQHLYMVMDFMAGGDMQTLLENFEFTEEWARFYIAEVVLAIDAVHQMGYAHRDVKPDNVLLDQRGHIKLADFGTCIRVGAGGKVRSKAAVGTPDYISPEVLESQDSNKPYTVHCDWWAVGVMLYEFLCTDPPFYCDTLVGTYSKIQQHQPDKLEFPDEIEISDPAKDFMRRLLSRKPERIGTAGGCEEIRGHPFFKSIDWDNICAMAPPHEPELASPEDTSQFKDPEPRDEPEELYKPARKFEGNQLPFIGFTYSRKSPLEERQAQVMLTSTPAVTPAFARVAASEIKNRRRSSTHRDSILALRSSEFETQLLQGENEALTKEVTALKSEVVALKAELEATANLSVVSQAAESEHNSLESSRLAEDQRIEFERLKAFEKDSTGAMEALKREIEGLHVEREGHERRIAAGAKRLSEAQEETESLQARMNTLTDQLAEERTKKGQLNQQVTLLTGQIEEHKAAQTQLQNKCDRAVKSRATIEAANEEMSEELRRLERKLKRAEEQVSEVEENKDKLVRKNSELTVRVSGLTSDNRQLEEDRLRLEGKISRLQDAIETPDARASAGNTAELSAQRLAEIESAHAQVVESLEEQLTAEREAKQSSTAELAELNLTLQKLNRDMTAAKARADEEQGNCMDLAHELDAKSSLYENVLVELADLQEEKEILATEFEIIEQRCEGLQSRLTSQTEQLQAATVRVEELATEREGHIPRERLTAAESEIRDLKVQIRKLENQHATDVLHISTERELAAKVHAASSEKLTEFRKEQLMSVEEVKAEYEVRVTQLTRQLRVKSEEYDALSRQSELDLKNLRSLNAQSRKRMTIRRAPNQDPLGDATNQMDPESRCRKAEKKNKSLEQELNTLKKKLEDVEAHSSARLERLQAEFDIAKDDWECKEEALRRQNADLQSDLGRKSADVEKLNTSLTKAANRISVLHETFSPQAPQSAERALVDLAETMEGTLWKPRKGNMKRHGWEEVIAKIDVSTFTLRGSGGEGQSNLVEWEASCIKKASAVKQEDVIHARANDVPCILQLVLVKVTKREEMPGEASAFADVHDKVDHDKYHFQGHLFEKATLEGSELCMVCKKACTTATSVVRMIGAGKNRPFNCIHCTKLVHLHHITNNEMAIGTCSGKKVVNKTLLLKAASPSERDRWLECFQLLIKRELKAVELERGYIDAGKLEAAAATANPTTEIPSTPVANMPADKETPLDTSGTPSKRIDTF